MDSQIQQAIKAITEFENKHGKPITEYEVTQEQYEQLRVEVSKLNTYSNLDMQLGNTIMGVKIKVVPSELEQLRQRVKELDDTNTALSKRIANQRKQLNDFDDVIDDLDIAVSCINPVEDLRRAISSTMKQLAASQLENKRLREIGGSILTELMNIAVANGANSVSMPDEYVEAAALLCEPTDTEALDKYMMERLGEPVAWGNFKDNGEACMLSISQHPEIRASWMNPKPLYALNEKP